MSEEGEENSNVHVPSVMAGLGVTGLLAIVLPGAAAKVLVSPTVGLSVWFVVPLLGEGGPAKTSRQETLRDWGLMDEQDEAPRRGT